MTMPIINPITGRERYQPYPRPRNEIYAELLASHQTDPDVNLFDLFYRLKTVVLDMEAMVTREAQQLNKKKKRTRK